MAAKRRVSIVIFYNSSNALLQDMRCISKIGEEHGFFGGEIKKKEDPESALRRGLIEELDPKNPEFAFFKKFTEFIP